MLYVVSHGRAQTHADLIRQAQQALDFRSSPTLRALGLVSEAPDGHIVQESLNRLLEGGYLADDGQLEVTETGRKRLHRSLGPTRGERHLLATQARRRSAAGHGHLSHG